MKWMSMNEELLSMCAQSLPKDMYALVLMHMQSNPNLYYVVYWNTQTSGLSVGLRSSSTFKTKDEVASITEFKEYILEKIMEN